MTEQKEVVLSERKRGFHLVTEEIFSEINLPEKGILHVFIKHTSAGLTINENADPSVRQVFNTFFNDFVPEDYPHFEHTMEGPDDMPAHIKSSLVGNSVSIPITDHRLNLGTWQGIYLCEFRNRGGRRKVVVTITS
jgi:secondary thiamine-phosphate synthase enzyme